MAIRSFQLGSFPDAHTLFETMAHEEHAVWLDSGQTPSLSARFDILGCNPSVTLTTWGDTTEIAGKTQTRSSKDDPLTLVKEELDRRSPVQKPDQDLPFSGGAIGYFAYELGNRFETLPTPPKQDTPWPEMAVGLYDWFVLFDRDTHNAQLIWDDALVSDADLMSYWQDRLLTDKADHSDSLPFQVIQEPLPDHSFDHYANAFSAVMDYLREGDCYQVNLAQRFSARSEGDPWQLYQKLRQINPAPFSAYLNYPWGQVLCASPERFLEVRDRVVETCPIKGTRPRHPNPEIDQKLATELKNSSKDQAENVMIVDLLRNDLGRSCQPGSIKVPKLFEVESFATVHHLISTVVGELDHHHDALDLLRGSFPGGSITGAPKVRAMEIIHELESKRRDVYCGSIGYIDYRGNMDTNIVIRTLLHRHGELTYWAGGGLVIDSQLESEYQETLDKAHALQRVLQKELWKE